MKEFIEKVTATGTKMVIAHETRDTVKGGLAKTYIWDRLSPEAQKMTIYLDHFWTPEEALGVYKRTALLASEEMHSMIMAIGNEVPILHCPFAECGRKRQMIKDMGVSVVTCKLEGGYLIKPKWADNKSKGPMFGRLVNTYSKEELAKLTPDEINDLIAKDLYFNVYDWQKEHHIPYDRKNRAERMEKILFRCPKCESMCKLKSEKDDLFCTECGYRVSVDECGLFVGDDLRFDNLCDWDLWQKECLKKELPNWEANPDMVIASDHGCELKKMNGNDTEILDTDVTVEMTYNDIIIKGEHTDMRMPLKELEGLASVRNGIGVSYQGQYYKVISAQYYTCMMRYRTIRRIIMGRTDL